MDEALKCTIKFCRVTGIPLDLREYDHEELMLAIAAICEEKKQNKDNDPPLGIWLPQIPNLVTIEQLLLNCGY